MTLTDRPKATFKSITGCDPTQVLCFPMNENARYGCMLTGGGYLIPEQLKILEKMGFEIVIKETEHEGDNNE